MMRRRDRDYSTLRKMLDECEFDWANGTIIRRTENEVIISTKIISNSDEILDEEFYCSFGSGGDVNIVAEDKDKIYFPMEYDGAEWLSFVYKDIRKYLNPSRQLPR